jgi:enoyl-CoA hydratase/carnithine racemase
MTSFENLRFEVTGHVAVITINHPPVNAWNLETALEFETAVENSKKDPNIRVVVITGGGEKCFSAGFDVGDADRAAVISSKVRELWTFIDRFSKPVIAAINGHATGGGLELAMACHFRFAARKSGLKLGLTELNLGIIPGWGGTQRLPRLVGRSMALDMIFFSKVVDPEHALEIGLVDRLSDPDRLMSDTLDFARRLAQRPPLAVQCVLEAFSSGMYGGLNEGLRVEAEGSATVRNSEDRQEGFRAFMEKRKPVFRGK